MAHVKCVAAMTSLGEQLIGQEGKACTPEGDKGEAGLNANRGKKMVADVKAAATARIDKAKAATMAQVNKAKAGAAAAMKWFKGLYEKNSSN